IRNAAPQEEGQARREIEIAETIGRARRQSCRFAFDAEQKARRREDALDPSLNSGVEAVFAPASLVEAEQRLDLAFGDGPSIRARGEGRQYSSRAWFFAGSILRTADEDPAACR